MCVYLHKYVYVFLYNTLTCKWHLAHERLRIKPLAVYIVPCAVARHHNTMLLTAVRLILLPVCVTDSSAIYPFELFYRIVVC